MYYKQSRRKIAKRRMTVFLIAVISVAAVLAVYFFFFSDIRINKPVLKDLEQNISDNVIASENAILYMQNNNLFCMDYNGQPIWTLPIDSGMTNFEASNNIISVFNDKSAQFFTFDKKQLFSAALDYSITNVKSGQNTVAILSLTQNETGKKISTIFMYDLKGSIIGNIDLTDRQIIDFGIYGDSDMLWTLSLDTSGVVPVSYIATFKPDGTMTGSIEINTQIVENVTVTNDSIYASGTNSLISYTYFGEKTQDTLIYGWKPYDYSIDASDIKMLYRTRTTGLDSELISSVKLLDGLLSDIMIYFPQEIFGAIVNPSGVYAFANYNIYIYNITGTLIKNIELETPVLEAKKISNKYAIVWDAATSYIFKLN